MSPELVNLLVKNFVQRRDVKAVQTSDGGYMPHVSDRDNPDETRLPWTRANFEDHLSGKQTFGHYMLDRDDKTKLFAFDIDLEQVGFLPSYRFPGATVEEVGGPEVWASDEEVAAWLAAFVPGDPRAAWADRAHVGRPWLKYQMRMIAGTLAAKIHSELEVRTAVAYSGSKGLHVYGLTGAISAADARSGAEIVLDATGDWQLTRGRNFFKHRDLSIETGYPNFSVEVYPKQGSLAGKDLGNLMRLPLGRNRKSPDPTFFVDMTAPMAELRPVDPIFALTCENAWADPRA